MASFKDKTGRSWTIELDAPLIRRVRELFGLNLVDLRADPFDRLANDPILQVDVLWILCQEEAKSRSMTDEDFGRALGPDLESSALALQEAVVNFFQPAKRSFIRSLIEEHAKVRDESQEMMLAKIRDPNLQKRVAAKMTEKAEAEIQRMIESLESTDFANSENKSSVTSSTDEMESTQATGARVSSL